MRPNLTVFIVAEARSHARDQLLRLARVVCRYRCLAERVRRPFVIENTMIHVFLGHLTAGVTARRLLTILTLLELLLRVRCASVFTGLPRLTGRIKHLNF